jgi:serine/threonine-protein kinase
MAIEINPRFVEPYYSRGYAYFDKGQYDKAISDFTKVIEINPRHAGAYNNIGWIYATANDPSYRNGAKAIEYAKKAVALEKTSGWDTLAAAYAENGDFSNAVTAEKEAVRLCTDSNKKKEFQELVEAYQSKKTYVQFKYGN